MAPAKLIVLEDGSYAMGIEGEKYPLYGFPRGNVLFGPLAKLKHLTKNLIFNQIWKMLEEKKSTEEIHNYLFKVAVPVLLKEIESLKYDMFPPERLCPSVREVWRAMEAIEQRISDRDSRMEFEAIKRGFTFFLQEDDAYRFRLQWAAKYIDPKNFWRRIYYFVTGKQYSFTKELEYAFEFLGHAEITPDMKGRSVLIKRIVFFLIEDPDFRALLERLVAEIDWKKVYLSKSDLYYLRGKYFKADLDHFDY